MSFEIKPLKGFNDLKFGMKRPEVKAALGEPDEIDFDEPDSADEPMSETWHYDELELSLVFEEAWSWKLCSMATSDKDAEILTEKLIGEEHDEVIEFLHQKGWSISSEENWDDEETGDQLLVAFDEQSVNLWFDEQILSEIQWGPEWLEKDEPVWPG